MSLAKGLLRMRWQILVKKLFSGHAGIPLGLPLSISHFSWVLSKLLISTQKEKKSHISLSFPFFELQSRVWVINDIRALFDRNVNFGKLQYVHLETFIQSQPLVCSVCGNRPHQGAARMLPYSISTLHYGKEPGVLGNTKLLWIQNSSALLNLELAVDAVGHSRKWMF